MMHMRVADEIRPAEASRYGRRPGNPMVLTLVVALHALLIALLLTYRFSVVEERRPPPLVVHMLDTTPPPPAAEPEKPLPETPPEPIRTPPPLALIPLAQQPALTVPREEPPPPPSAEPVPAPAPPPPAPPQTVSAGDLSSSMVHAPPPRYPTESRRKREEGTVLLAVLLGTDGRVADIRIARSSGHERLDQAALRAVRQWRWSPTMRGGAAVQIRGTVEIPFVLLR